MIDQQSEDIKREEEEIKFHLESIVTNRIRKRETDIGFWRKFIFYLQMLIFIGFQFIPLVVIVYCVVIDMINQISTLIIHTYNFIFSIASGHDAFFDGNITRNTLVWLDKICWFIYGYPMICILFSFALKLANGFFGAIGDFFSNKYITNLYKDFTEYWVLKKITEKEISKHAGCSNKIESIYYNHKISYLKSRLRYAFSNFIISIVIMIITLIYGIVILLSFLLDFDTTLFHFCYVVVYLAIPIIGLIDVLLRSLDYYFLLLQFKKKNKIRSLKDIVVYYNGRLYPAKKEYQMPHAHNLHLITTSFLRMLQNSKVIQYLYPCDLGSMSDLSETLISNVGSFLFPPPIFVIALHAGLFIRVVLITIDVFYKTKTSDSYFITIYSYIIYDCFSCVIGSVFNLCYSWTLSIGHTENIVAKAKLMLFIKKVIKHNTKSKFDDKEGFAAKNYKYIWYYSPRQFREKFDIHDLAIKGRTFEWPTVLQYYSSARSKGGEEKEEKNTMDKESDKKMDVFSISSFFGIQKVVPEIDPENDEGYEWIRELNRKDEQEEKEALERKEAEKLKRKYEKSMDEDSEEEYNEEEEDKNEDPKAKKDSDILDKYFGKDSYLKKSSIIVEVLYFLVFFIIAIVTVAIIVWRDPTSRTGGQKYHIILSQGEGKYTDRPKYPFHCYGTVSNISTIELSLLPQMGYFSTDVISEETREYNTRLLQDMAFRNLIKMGKTVNCEHHAEDHLVDCEVQEPDGNTSFHVIIPHGMVDRRDWLYLLEMLIMQYTSMLIEQLIPMFEMIMDLFGKLIYFVQDGIQRIVAVNQITIHRAKALHEYASRINGSNNIAVGQNIGGYFAKYIAYTLPEKFSAYSWDSLSFMKGALKLDEVDGPIPNIVNVFSEASFFGSDEECAINIERSKYVFGTLKSYTRPPNATDAFCKTVAECSNEQRFIDFCESTLGHESFEVEMNNHNREYVKRA